MEINTIDMGFRVLLRTIADTANMHVEINTGEVKPAVVVEAMAGMSVVVVVVRRQVQVDLFHELHSLTWCLNSERLLLNSPRIS